MISGPSSSLCALLCDLSLAESSHIFIIEASVFDFICGILSTDDTDSVTNNEETFLFLRLQKVLFKMYFNEILNWTDSFYLTLLVKVNSEGSFESQLSYNGILVAYFLL